MKRVFWSILPERCVYDASFNMGLSVAMRCGQKGYSRISVSYGRTDETRQMICDVFLANTTKPDDTLVMLDVDQEHPADIVDRLVARDVPVVAPMYFRRCPPYECCAFRRNGDGGLHHLASFPPGLHQMDAVGTGAIAIRRHVLSTLRDSGHQWFFQYRYEDKDGKPFSPSEDMYFCSLCERHGIPMYVDTTIESPHITYGYIDREVHESYLRDNPIAKMEVRQKPRNEETTP